MSRHESGHGVSRLIELTAPALDNTSGCVVSSVFEQLQEHYALLKQLLEAYPEGFLESLPMDHWPKDISPLHSAAARTTSDATGEKMELLLKYFSAFVSMQDSRGRTPLWQATFAGNVEVTRLLLPLTERPLGEAIEVNGAQVTMAERVLLTGGVEVLSLLVEFEPSLRTSPNAEGLTLLEIAEANGAIRRREEILAVLQPRVKRAA